MLGIVAFRVACGAMDVLAMTRQLCHLAHGAIQYMGVLGRLELVEQCLGLSQIGRIEPLGEPAVDLG